MNALRTKGEYLKLSHRVNCECFKNVLRLFTYPSCDFENLLFDMSASKLLLIHFTLMRCDTIAKREKQSTKPFK